MQPIVSIITPVFNAEKYLPATISSVQAQTFKDYEHLLVIDSKSTDNSLKISLAASLADPRIKVIQSSGALSAASNRNLGIEKAMGEYLAFLDADDTWPARKLELQLQFTKEQNADFTYTAFCRMSEDGSRISEPTFIPKQIDYYDLLKLNVIAIHTALLKREFVGQKRFPDVVHEDFAFWLELLRPHGQQKILAFGLNQPLAYYRSTPGSTAYNKKKAALWRWKILRDFEKIPVPQALYYFCQYAVRASLLHRKTKI